MGGQDTKRNATGDPSDELSPIEDDSRFLRLHSGGKERSFGRLYDNHRDSLFQKPNGTKDPPIASRTGLDCCFRRAETFAVKPGPIEAANASFSGSEHCAGV